MPVNLTEPGIRKAIREAPAGSRKDLVDAACRGLRLRPNRDKTATWALACRDNYGRMRRFSVGKYPDMGISDAREAAKELRSKVRYQAMDPIAESRRRRTLANSSVTPTSSLAGLLELYAKKASRRQKTWSESQTRIERVFSSLLKRPLAAVTARDLQITADDYPAVSSASAAVRYLRPVLKWAAQRGYVDDQVANIRPPQPVQRRERVLRRSEIAAILPALRASDRPHAAAMHFMLLTLARRDEVADAQWRHIDFAAGSWTIENPKNSNPHVVPLSRQALALLKSRMPDPEAPNGLVFSTDTGGGLSNWDRETKRIQQTSGISGWHRHDLRRTGATMLGEMGELPDIVEAALNHTSIRSPLAATYNRSRYRPQVAAALQRLADALDEVAESGNRKAQ